MIHTPAASAIRARRVARRMRPRKRGPLSEETRAKISEALKGNRGPRMYGKARDIGEWEPLPLIREMGRLLRDARIAADVSMEELARASGVSEESICRIENGVSRRKHNAGARVETIFRLALALGVRPYELMP